MSVKNSAMTLPKNTLGFAGSSPSDKGASMLSEVKGECEKDRHRPRAHVD